jgi:1,4-dihydroxy-2-naphthoate octaprenyltransferase
MGAITAKLRICFLETRPQFLTLPVALAFLGNSVAWYHGSFSLRVALLSFVGLLLAHISVNTFNDYFDYRSGVDLKTNKTPFSGGSGILPSSLLGEKEVLWLATGSFILAAAIGVYFVITTGWLLLPLLLVAAVCILFYTSFILKTHWPEWSPGLGLGVLPVLGVYFVQTGTYTWPALVAAIPSGILVHNLLLINELPDVEADSTANRKTLPIVLGKDRASLVYAALLIIMYIWIAGFAIAGIMPLFSLLALLSIPLAIKAIRGSRHHDDMSRLVPGLANNVFVVLLTQVLLGIGYVLSAVV